jgi:hypothetical protein
VTYTDRIDRHGRRDRRRNSFLDISSCRSVAYSQRGKTGNDEDKNKAIPSDESNARSRQRFSSYSSFTDKTARLATGSIFQVNLPYSASSALNAIFV